MTHNAVPLLALLLFIALGVYMATKPPPAPPPELPACTDPAFVDGIQQMARREIDEPPYVQERGALSLSSIAETGFDATVQTRDCAAVLTVAATGPFPENPYNVDYRIAWRDRDDNDSFVTVTDLRRTRLPPCGNEGVIESVAATALDLMRARTPGTLPGATIKERLTVTAVEETALDDAAQKRRCAGSLALDMGGDTLDLAERLTYVISWGDRPRGVTMIEVALED